MCKKRKLNSSLKNYTYPGPNKAILSLNSGTSDKKISTSRIKIAIPAINQLSISQIKIAIPAINERSISLRQNDQIAILKKGQ